MAKKEVHDAIVVRNEDPDLGTDLRGAVFFIAPTLFDGEYPSPAYPMFQFASDKGAGFFFVPKVGDKIEVEILVDDGTSDTADVEAPEPRWRCMVYTDANDIDEEFKTNYPFRMGWKSNSGHIFLFDDKEGEEIVKIGHMIGTILKLDKDGSWLETIIKNKMVDIANNYSLQIGGDESRIIVGDKSTSIGGEETKTVVGDSTETVMGKKKIASTGETEINATSKAKVKGSTVELNIPLGNVLTNISDPIVDNITGAPHIGVPTVKAG